jgi:hypothetical protein
MIGMRERDVERAAAFERDVERGRADERPAGAVTRASERDFERAEEARALAAERHREREQNDGAW